MNNSFLVFNLLKKILWNSTDILVIIMIISLFHFSESIAKENKGGKGGIAISANKEYFFKPMEEYYPLELFPGQEFDGWWYFWSLETVPITAQLQESPEVSWLSISPTTFTSDSCTDIEPVKYSFTAPMTQGVYIDTVKDLNGHWDDMVIILNITEEPTPDWEETVELEAGQSVTLLDTNYFTEWTDMGCLPLYIPDSKSDIVYTLFPQVSWLTIVPSQFTLPIHQLVIVDETFSHSNPGNYSCYEIWTAQYLAYPYYTKWYLDVLTDIHDNSSHSPPVDFKIFQNYPNPFNPSTTIAFDLPRASDVNIKILNILGEEVATLVSEKLNSGNYQYEWDAGEMASGVYFYQLEIENFTQTRKMVLMR